MKPSPHSLKLNSSFLSEIFREHQMAPTENFHDTPKVLYVTPPPLYYRQLIRFTFGAETLFEEAKQHKVEQLLQHWFNKLSPNLNTQEADTNHITNEQELRDLASEAPIIRTVNHLFERACNLKASDIHFQPEENGLSVRTRVDGVMTTIETIPSSAQAATLSRLKLIANLNIGEKRVPQDGRIHYPLGERQLDLRVSTLPGIHGESIVLRILDRNDLDTHLGQLGIPDEILKHYIQIVQQPQGMILVTGPTGSGKTTTLYATLKKINSEEKKTITIEDPIEYQLDGVSQVQVNEKIGMGFASGLRSIVRQDPDIIMVGEIRDQKTAKMATESALTGHLIFSTLHTNDAASAITRLEEMGIAPYLLSSSLSAIVAQRLARKVCTHCCQQTMITHEQRLSLQISSEVAFKISHGTGCEQCRNTGYNGRVGLYELLMISDSIKEIISNGGGANEIHQQALHEGMQTLHQDGINKLRNQMTTVEELLRVTKIH
ncbi:MAG: type II/IV secretion system protein [Gammaproteobacteria bacterium]|jgi:general secretion pathway protein E|nr:type II/IV secretion system protein [Gammaproteobacteria bacterium]MBT4129351.1 type II/IV secretion system protein [Candidatus Neomarinimicrobiota bacterium]MBT5373028.1 type II/IV secretion system protein [Gammaproteobacteria bacterium]